MERDAEIVKLLVNQPLAKLQAAESRVSHIEAKVSQADYYIARALDTTADSESLRGALRIAHATLKEALAGESNLRKVA